MHDHMHKIACGYNYISLVNWILYNRSRRELKSYPKLLQGVIKQSTLYANHSSIIPPQYITKLTIER